MGKYNFIKKEINMELVFLGTGAGVPAKERNVSSIALHLFQERGTTWLFDCGEATQHQILFTNVKLGKIDKIFITHLHGDHIFGLPGLLGSRSFQGAETKLTVYGPTGIKDFIQVSMKVSNTHLKYELEIIEFSEGIIFDDESFQVEVRKVSHGIDSFGFRIIEKDLPGTLLVEKLKKIGVRPGPEYAKLKRGENIQLEDNKIIYASEYIGEVQKGRIISIIGDTKPCPAIDYLSKDADVLVHESTFSESEEKNAHEFYHSTTKDAANSADRNNVKKLIITHISSRYQGKSCQLLLEETRNIFQNSFIAEDLKEFKIERKRTTGEN